VVCGRSWWRHFGRGGSAAIASRETAADFKGHVIVERTGMRFFVGDAQFRQKLKDNVGLDLELASELVDADFTHTVAPRRMNFLH
jgi:hypothetical protein